MMAAEKLNHFLDAEESDDDHSQGYDSEAEHISKSRRSAKRRKLEPESEEDVDFSADEDQLEESPGHEVDGETGNGAEDADEGVRDAEAAQKHPARHEPRLRDNPGNSVKKNLIVTEAAIKKSGVVYLSRIPPFMKPTKLRSLLEPYGKINRIFLSPEDSTARSRRIRAGGNKKRTFTDGWVEFVRKQDAKAVCEVLNGQTIGGKKGSFYRDDIWTLLYLKGFKWHDLTEQIAAENAERASRMRAEISKATKENKEFVRNVERAKMLDGMEAKREAKGGKGPAAGVGVATIARIKGNSDEQVDTVKDKPRTFKQVPVAKKKGEIEETEQVRRVLSKIF